MKPRPFIIGEPPAPLKRAKLDNIALVPASLLPLKETYQPIANKLPAGSVLCIPATPRQQKIVAKVVEYFQKLAAASDRVKFEEIGKSTMGAPFVYATISAP